MASSSLAFAQDETIPREAPGAVTPQPAIAAPPQAGPQADPQAVFRAPLVREGAQLVDVRGRLCPQTEARPGTAAAAAPTAAAGTWKLVVDSGAPELADREMILLPCTRLAEMLRILTAMPDESMLFEVSGQVFVYRNQNYLLPRHATIVVPDDAGAPASSSPVASDGPAASAPATSTVPQTAEEMIRRLEEAAGPIDRSAGAAPPNPRSSGETDLPSQPRRFEENGRAGSTDVANSLTPNLLREGTSITGRRGTITRDSGGGWLVVFDADASGLADPPVKLLPCLLLERIEAYAQRQGNNSPALLSGPVYVYEGRNFLLPTVFRIPHERKNLTP